jgi:hypothetical protein
LQQRDYNTETTMNKLTLLMLMMLGTAGTVSAQNTPVSQMEKLDRGLVVIPCY